MSISEDLGWNTAAHPNQEFDPQSTDGLAPGDLRSFRMADMIIEATDAAGQLHYIAVGTADQRDVDRPIATQAT